MAKMSSMSQRRKLPRIARGVVALLAVGATAACQREPERPSLAPADLGAPESAALQGMISAGARPFAGWTWHYEFGAPCTLRVVKRFEGRMVPATEHVLKGYYVEIVPYASEGYGVKAYPLTKGGSADLFDTHDKAVAEAFAQKVQRLLAWCERAPLS
jgi:hypothetical protein